MCILSAVPIANKRDQRTIEQVLADTRAKKKQKLDPSVESSGSPLPSGDADTQEAAEKSADAESSEGVGDSNGEPSCS